MSNENYQEQIRKIRQFVEHNFEPDVDYYDDESVQDCVIRLLGELLAKRAEKQG